jgi:hypothetical protein
MIHLFIGVNFFCIFIVVESDKSIVYTSADVQLSFPNCINVRKYSPKHLL